MVTSGRTNVRKTIIYLLPVLATSAASIKNNARRRIKVMRSLGYKVRVIEYVSAIRVFLSLLRFQKNSIVCVIIRIDGSGKLDILTLAKLFMESVLFVWEVHGFPEEKLYFSHDLITRANIWIRNIARRLLSYTVDAVMFISPELYTYAQGKMYISDYIVSQNFVGAPIRKKRSVSLDASTPVLLKDKRFIVLWGGTGKFPWQALDLIQQTAHMMERRDVGVAFVIVGSDFWYPVQQTENLMILPSVSSGVFREYIHRADVCLALYHSLTRTPFYMCPMKLLDYMDQEKPVIVSSHEALRNMIDYGSAGIIADNTSQDISKKILILKDNKSLRQRLSHYAKKLILERYSMRVARKQYKAMLIKFIQ